MSAGRCRKAELGKVAGSKDAPYGYRYVRDDRHKVIGLEMCEPEARIVRIIFRWCLYGEDGRHPMTLWQIAKRLAGDHVLPLAQSRGYTKIGRYRIRLGVWNDGSVGKIVHNQTYAGIWRYGKTDAKGQPRPAEDHKKEFYDQKLVSAEKIEEYVWHQIERFFKNGRLLDWRCTKPRKAN